MAKIPIQLSSGQLSQPERVVGIDLGTTNSLIAVMDENTRSPKVIPNQEGLFSTPSLVYIDPVGSVEVGVLARSRMVDHPSAVVYSVKRLMGVPSQTFEESPETFSFAYPVRVSDRSSALEIGLGPTGFTPEQVSARILMSLKKQAEDQLSCSVKRAVITVPAYFNDAQRQATREAGRLAGLEVLRIINEPTAASLAYGIGADPEGHQRVAVYDLGGGTFDISILDITDGVFEVLATHGDTHLGGDDFDQCILAHWSTLYSWTEAFFQQHRSSLRVLAEQAKCVLSEQDVFSADFGGDTLSLNRVEFEHMIDELVLRTLRSCQQALTDAGCSVDSIDEVVLVGGSTRVPLVIQKVSAFFNREVRHSIDPDQVVALGAAVQADILAGNNRQTLLLDVTPLSLGIETAGGLMDVLIPRNSKVPARVARQYTTQKDGQTGIRISVYQGERDQVVHNRLLATFHLKGIPAMPAGLAKVQVSFLINADGILQVSAKELRSGVEQSISLNDKIGLDDAQVEQMIEESILHASSDIAERRMAELRVEAEQLIDRTQSFIRKNATELTGEETRSLQEGLSVLMQPLSAGDPDQIQSGMNHLEELSRPIAERIMDLSVRNALHGKKIL